MRLARRAVVTATAATVVALGSFGTALASPTSCFVSSTTVEQGGSITVSGQGDTELEALFAIMDGSTQVGSGNAGTGTPITYSFTVTIPSSTTAGVTHTLDVQNGATVGCPDILVTEAEAAEPTPTPTPDDEEDEAETQETLDDILQAIEALDERPAAVPAQQQQQQQQILPAVASTGGGGGASLPKTGAEVMDLGGVGAALLMVGGSLIRLARRRRRPQAEPVTAPPEEPDFIFPSF